MLKISFEKNWASDMVNVWMTTRSDGNNYLLNIDEDGSIAHRQLAGKKK